MNNPNPKPSEAKAKALNYVSLPMIYEVKSEGGKVITYSAGAAFNYTDKDTFACVFNLMPPPGNVRLVIVQEKPTQNKEYFLRYAADGFDGDKPIHQIFEHTDVKILRDENDPKRLVFDHVPPIPTGRKNKEGNETWKMAVIPMKYARKKPVQAFKSTIKIQSGDKK